MVYVKTNQLLHLNTALVYIPCLHYRQAHSALRYDSVILLPPPPQRWMRELVFFYFFLSSLWQQFSV